MSSEGWSRMPEIGPGIKALANGWPPPNRDFLAAVARLSAEPPPLGCRHRCDFLKQPQSLNGKLEGIKHNCIVLSYIAAGIEKASGIAAPSPA